MCEKIQSEKNPNSEIFFAVKENKINFSVQTKFILLFNEHDENRPIISITIQKEIILVISFAKRLDYSRVLMGPMNNHLA